MLTGVLLVMTIDQRPQSWIKHTLFIGIIAALTACGGSGGGGGGPTPGPDTPPDTTPNAFTLNVVDDAVPGAEVISEPFTVSGINAPTPISIEGGQYAVNGGAYTSAAGTVRNGDTVRVKVTSSGTLQTDVKATLTIGGVAGTFIVTTLADTTPPTAQITFPPPVSMKDGDSILVRGTASDDYSTITSVTVGGVAAESDDGFATWTALVTLTEGDNIINVVVEDENNTNNAATSVSVRRTAYDVAFPDNEVPITYATGIAVDAANNRVLVPNYLSGEGDYVIAIDLAKGIRTVLSGPGVPDNANAFIVPEDIAIDPVASRNRAIVADMRSIIFEVNLTNGARNILSDNATPNDQQPDLDSPLGIALDPANEDVAYIIDSILDNLQRIDLVTGERTLVSDNAMPDSGPEFFMPKRLLIDSENNRAIVIDIYQPQLFSVDLANGLRSVLFGNGVPEPESDVNCPVDIATDDIQSRIFITDCEHGINMLDLDTNTLSNVFGPVTRIGFNNGFLSFPKDAAFALYVERDTQALYAIDLMNWDFVILSKSIEQ
jgi:hypothetical protein